MGKHQREKGHRWEREIAKRLGEIFKDHDVKRGFQYRGGEQPDVCCPAFWVEAKHHKRVNLRKALEQAQSDSDGTGKCPVAICKDDNKTPVVVMTFEDWLDLIKSWWQLSSE